VNCAVLTPTENARLTCVGPETPAGAFMRCYWQPAVLSEELPENDGPPVRVRLLGEDLISFRDAEGDVLLVTEPAWNAPRKAYFTWEGGGLVWAYLGPADALPAPPDYGFVRVTANRRNVVKIFQDNNWLQSLEGAIDSVHSGFLHNDDMHEKSQLRNAPARVEFERTVHGLAGAAIHALGDGRNYVRAFAYIMPAHSLRVRTLGRTGVPEDIPTISGQIWVPIDDTTSWLYNYMYAMRPERPLTDAFVRARNASYGRGPDDFESGYRLKRNRGNDYLIDRGLQRRRSFSGIKGMNTQDIALQECMGPVLDRSKEHLAHSDRVIIALRKTMFDAIDTVERGEHPGGTEPLDYADVRLADVIVDERIDWKDALKETACTA